MDWEPLIRLAVAAGLAAAIGIDRELRSKPAGLRTNIVVSVAAAAFAYLGSETFPIGGDPTRVASQVVSGIGFLGGGAIFAAGAKPHGLTTAAALWGSAAIGIAAGTGAMDIALAVVVVTLLALWPLDLLSTRVFERIGRRDVHVHVLVDEARDLIRVQQLIAHAGVRVLEADVRELGKGMVYESTLSAGREAVNRVLLDLRRLEGAVLVSNVAVTAEDR